MIEEIKLILNLLVCPLKSLTSLALPHFISIIVITYYFNKLSAPLISLVFPVFSPNVNDVFYIHSKASTCFPFVHQGVIILLLFA